MLNANEYIFTLTGLLRDLFGARLLYVVLQGSYLRGEATEHSDIDVMVVIEDMRVADLAAYREAIMTLPEPDKSCGFICGREELRHWNPLEICHLLHTTRDFCGTLRELVPAYTAADVAAYVKMSVGNLYHELCHRYVHAPRQSSIGALPQTCKALFFILQNLHYLETGRFIATKRELLQALSGNDRQALAMALSLSRAEPASLEEALSLLLSWCREALVRTSSIAGTAL